MADFKIVLGNKNYSSWSLRGWLALKRCGVAFDEEVIPLYQDDWRARLLAVSPAGKVPVLLHGERTVWDSLAIVEYLAELFPEVGLWPEGRDARAVARARNPPPAEGAGSSREGWRGVSRERSYTEPRGGSTDDERRTPESARVEMDRSGRRRRPRGFVCRPSAVPVVVVALVASCPVQSVSSSVSRCARSVPSSCFGSDADPQLRGGQLLRRFGSLRRLRVERDGALPPCPSRNPRWRRCP